MPLSNTGIDRFLAQNYYSKSQLNAGQLDSRYFAESEFIATSAGAGDAGKPVKLNGSGQVDTTMYGSSVVTLTGTQTLTNKTLTGPSMSYPIVTGDGAELMVNATTSNPVIYLALAGVAEYGMYYNNANTYFAITEAGVADHFVVKNGGNVGIGTTSPGTKLEVNGTITATAATIGGAAVTTASNTQTLTNKTLTSPTIGTSLSVTGPSTFTGALSETALNSDNIRIGVVSGVPRIMFEDNGATQVGIDNSAGTLRFLTPGLVRATLDISGNFAATGTISSNSVLVDTISGANTLTNKTLTSPLISQIYGGSAANADLTLEGTSSATKASSYIIVQPTGGSMVVGGSTGEYELELQNQGASNLRLTFNVNDSGEQVIASIDGAPGVYTQAPMRIYGSRIRINGVLSLMDSATPASAAAAGTAGDIAWDTSFIYVAVGTDTWKRAALSTW
jgi:hypothetical protein